MKLSPEDTVATALPFMTGNSNGIAGLGIVGASPRPNSRRSAVPLGAFNWHTSSCDDAVTMNAACLVLDTAVMVSPGAKLGRKSNGTACGELSRGPVSAVSVC